MDQVLIPASDNLSYGGAILHSLNCDAGMKDVFLLTLSDEVIGLSFAS